MSRDNKHTGESPQRTNQMTLQEIRELLATEKAAKNAFFAANQTRTATKAQRDAMVAATKARQAAVAQFALEQTA